MPRSSDPVVLSSDQRNQLQGWVMALGTPQQVALRCRIILAVAAGKTEMMIASENGVNRKTVRLWRERFRSGGPCSLGGCSRPGPEAPLRCEANQGGD